jgi:hypothetical protein
LSPMPSAFCFSYFQIGSHAFARIGPKCNPPSSTSPVGGTQECSTMTGQRRYSCIKYFPHFWMSMETLRSKYNKICLLKFYQDYRIVHENDVYIRVHSWVDILIIRYLSFHLDLLYFIPVALSFYLVLDILNLFLEFIVSVLLAWSIWLFQYLIHYN